MEKVAFDFSQPSKSRKMNENITAIRDSEFFRCFNCTECVLEKAMFEHVDKHLPQKAKTWRQRSVMESHLILLGDTFGTPSVTILAVSAAHGSGRLSQNDNGGDCLAALWSVEIMSSSQPTPR